MQVIFSPRATEELDDAALYYDQEQPGLGDRFLAAVEHASIQVGRTPMLYPAGQRGIRRCLLRRFPYVLLYSVEADYIYVIVVAHQHRKPGYWHDRLPNP